MATVKSLEERVDDIADDLSAIKVGLATLTAQMATLTAQVSSMNAQLAIVVTRLDNQATQLAANASQLNVLIPEFSALKAKADTYFGGARWAVAFLLGLAVTVVFAAITVSNSAGRLEATILQQQKTLDDMKHDITEVRTKLK